MLLLLVTFSWWVTFFLIFMRFMLYVVLTLLVLVFFCSMAFATLTQKRLFRAGELYWMKMFWANCISLFKLCIQELGVYSYILRRFHFSLLVNSAVLRLIFLSRQSDVRVLMCCFPVRIWLIFRFLLCHLIVVLLTHIKFTVAVVRRVEEASSLWSDVMPFVVTCALECFLWL